MNLPIFISKRYLFAKKTHNVINIISYISVVGMALGTLALIVILSVQNGFDKFIKSLYTSFDSDIRITAVEGKVFDPTTVNFTKLRQLEGIASYSEVVEENVLLTYQVHRQINDNDVLPSPKQWIAVMKGVDDNYTQTSDIENLLATGEFELKHGDIRETVMGRSIAEKLGIGLGATTPVKVWFPERGEKITSDPLNNIRYDFVYPSGLIGVDQTIDAKYFFTAIDFARELLSYTVEASAVELRVAPDANADKVQQQVQELLGPSFSVKNRYQQNETLYRMIVSEKLSIYLILLFILAIVSFNIIGSLSMLMVDKKKDIATLQSMGADISLIKRIFLFEGWLISIFGALIGMGLGLAICWLQITFGIVRMPAGFLVDAYPVSISWLDVVIVLTLVILMGYLVARMPVSYLAKRLKA